MKMANQRMLFPEPAMNGGGHEGQVNGTMEERTFSMDPQ
jgi:hypothetical protein